MISLSNAPQRGTQRTTLPLCALLLVAFPALSSSPALGAAPALAASPGATAQEKNDKDVITFRDGKTEAGRISAEEYGGVNFEPAKGSKRTIAWNEIGSISYSSSVDFESARAQMEQGKLDEALTAFEALKSEKGVRSLLKQHIEYYTAWLQQRTSKLDEALASYALLLKDFPKTRYLTEVGQNIAAIYLAKKDPAGATKALEELGANATTAGVEAGFSGAVTVLRGRVLEDQKKWSEAFSAFNAAEKSTGVSAQVAQQAQLGQARVNLAQNKKSDAEPIFRKLTTAENASNAVLAGAWNGLADITRDDGHAKKDSGVLLDALYMYMRGVVQYGALPGESTTEYEHALKGAAECFEYLSALEPKPDLKRSYKENAAARLKQLQQEFPNSIYLGSR